MGESRTRRNKGDEGSAGMDRRRGLERVRKSASVGALEAPSLKENNVMDQNLETET